MEVATPVIFGIGIIILVFLPLMTLQGMEGKMFAPLAYTIAIALAVSLVLSLTLTPVLSSYLLKGGADHDTWLIAKMKKPYLKMLTGRWPTAARRWWAAWRCWWCAGDVALPGHRLHSGNEGRLGGAGYQPGAQHFPRRVAQDGNAGDEAGDGGAGREVGHVRRGSRRVAGRPAGPERVDAHCQLKPRDEWPEGWTQDTIPTPCAKSSRRCPASRW
jgi:cobalt-zinc-cadmium resistance protein CzcA